MSTFAVTINRIKIEPHPDADAIELAVIGEYRSVVKKGIYKTGELVAYIPEAAVLPEWLLKEQGFWSEEENKGTLAGSKGNRVKAIRLRGIMSQGICYPINLSINMINNENSEQIAKEFDDVTEFLGITKYEPPIPIAMAGEVCNLFGYTINYDIENWKKYPTLIQDGEEVIFTEKVHGTWCVMAYVQQLNHPEIEEGKFVVSSKGLSQQGLAFKFNENNSNNVYIRMFFKIKNKIKKISEFFETSVYVLGEIFGPIQDLRYGFSEPQFRVFDIYVGLPGNGYYLDKPKVIELCTMFDFESVPLLYQGPFSIKILKQYTEGKETVSGHEIHIREGLVINVVPERFDILLGGRLVLKSVSDAYLARKGKNLTEFN